MLRRCDSMAGLVFMSGVALCEKKPAIRLDAYWCGRFWSRHGLVISHTQTSSCARAQVDHAPWTMHSFYFRADRGTRDATCQHSTQEARTQQVAYSPCHQNATQYSVLRTSNVASIGKPRQISGTIPDPVGGACGKTWQPHGQNDGFSILIMSALRRCIILVTLLLGNTRRADGAC
jgi:hypothetical protein